MATTANQIITRALQILNVVEDGATASANQLSDGLTTLNNMLEAWALDRMSVYYIAEANYTLSNESILTVGSGGTWSTIARPNAIPQAWIRIPNGTDIPLIMLDDREWAAIRLKSLTGYYPQYLYYKPTFPAGTLNFWPVVSSPCTLYINYPATLQNFAAGTDNISLPPGYLRAIIWNLAAEFAPEYGELSPSVARMAKKTLAPVRRINNPDYGLQIDAGALPPRRTFNIYAGT